MEPRPRGRGNGTYLILWHTPELTSMEPRPRGRGNQPGAGGKENLIYNFNGATTSRSWKSRTSSVSSRPLVTLQWSHDLAVVEIHIRVQFFTRAIDTSMEPRPRGRGNILRNRSSSRGQHTSMEPRPRGRGNTDGRQFLVGRRGHFNGATTSRSWKCEKPSSPKSLKKLLQWSHDLAVVEIPPFEVHTYHTVVTSMEPRPRGRGNASLAPRPWRKRSHFNGATTSRSWKSDQPNVDARRAELTSMEPRPRGRGNHTAATDVTRERPTSMEPRPRGRGNELPRIRSAQKKDHFNGATTSRSWK